MTTTISAKSVSVTLQDRQVLSGLDYATAAGELVAIVGPNGAGKTTLLRVLAGLLPADAGAVYLDGMDIRHLPRRSMAQRLAYLPQDHAIHWGIRVLDVVKLGRLPHRRTGRPLGEADDRAIATALDTMDIAQFADRPVTNLSGGERARVAIARALAQDPLVLLADEPASGLDAVHQIELFEHLRKLADKGRAVVVVLHDLSLAARFCDRLVIMKAGRVHSEGPPTVVLSDETLCDVYGMSAHMGEVYGIPFVVPLASLSQPCETPGLQRTKYLGSETR